MGTGWISGFYEVNMNWPSPANHE